MAVHDHKRGEPYEPQLINPQDLSRRKELAKELTQKCRSYFEDKAAEWYELKNEIRE